MNSMKKVISERDYEQYKILVPVKFFMAGKRRKYISSQLEKMHPCFSDSFCFDSKYGLSKKGLVANVTVMDKLRLGEYKANYPGSMLTCEENSKACVFVDKKMKAILTLLFCLPLFAILFFNLVWKSGKQKSKIVESVNESIEEIGVKNENTKFAYERFFDLLEKQDGKIDSLNWKYDGFTENLSVGVKNCYPDLFSTNGFSDAQMMKATFSNISYANDIPSFSMSVSNKKIESVGNQNIAGFENVSHEDSSDLENLADDVSGDLENLSVGGSSNFRSSVRDALRKNAVKVTSENYQPYKIRFQVSEKNVNGNLFESIEEITDKNGWSVNEIALNLASKDSVEMELSFTNDFCYSAEKPILSSIKNGWKNLAVEKKSAEKDSDSKKSIKRNNQAANETVRKVVSVPEKNQLNSGDKKLGTITHADGTKVVYYKTVKGVIRNE